MDNNSSPLNFNNFNNFDEELIELSIDEDTTIDIYLQRCSKNPDEYTHNLAELSFVTSSLTATLCGISKKELRKLAHFLNDYAKRL